MPNKTEQSIGRMFGFRSKFGCIDSFLLPNSRNEEMMVMVSFGATAAGLF